MKKFFVASSLFAMSVFAMADNVLTVNGEPVGRDFTTMTVDTQIPGNVIVNFSDGSAVSYCMNLLEVRPNDELIEDGIKQTEQSAGFFTIQRAAHNVLAIDGTEAGATISVYSSNGSLVLRGKSSGTHHEVNVAGLSKGVYILRVGGSAIKFNKD